MNAFFFPQAIRKGLVYALRYENFDSLSAGQDVTEHRRTRHMVPPMSPVGVFAVRQSRGSRGKSRLYPVAIQMDYTPGNTSPQPNKLLPVLCFINERQCSGCPYHFDIVPAFCGKGITRSAGLESNPTALPCGRHGDLKGD